MILGNRMLGFARTWYDMLGFARVCLERLLGFARTYSIKHMFARMFMERMLGCAHTCSMTCWALLACSCS